MCVSRFYSAEGSTNISWFLSGDAADGNESLTAYWEVSVTLRMLNELTS